jgi:hypothetical protein
LVYVHKLGRDSKLQLCFSLVILDALSSGLGF